MNILIRRIRRNFIIPRRLKPVLALLGVLGVMRLMWLSPHPSTESNKDWQDYAAMSADQRRSGLGEQGEAAELPASVDTKLKNDLFQQNGFNALLSDSISLNRSIKELRHPDCSSLRYRSQLPTAALVIPFHEEHLSVLLRTIASCQNRAPANLLKEVILVDDASKKPALGAELVRSLRADQFQRVRLHRAPAREGLIRARMRGIAAASADVVIVMDSHCECNYNWLPPLLDPIAEDYRTVVCPFIDVIDMHTFAIREQDSGARGSWSWNSFHYKRLPLLSDSLRNPAKPFASPVMAGGLFAISRRWFHELGGYDEGLDIWGGEQYELSFKIWQCGGRMLDAPCSRVAHIYRNFMPYRNPTTLGDFMTRNFKRVAEVWMDEYKHYLYSTNNEEQYRLVDSGDLTKQKAVRNKLKCHSFDWFIKHVAFDQPQHYPYYQPLHTATGKLQLLDKSLCVIAAGVGSQLRVGDCDKATMLHLSKRDEIRLHNGAEHCFDVPDGRTVQLFSCHGMRGNQYFKYFPQIQRMRHVASGKCVAREGSNVVVDRCMKANVNQHWSWIEA